MRNVIACLSLLFLIATVELSNAEPSATSSSERGVSEKASRTVVSTYEAASAEVSENVGKLSNEQIEKKLKQIIAPVFDFTELSRRCIGPAWTDVSKEKKEEFAALFSSLLVDNFMSLVRAKITSWKISVVDEKEKGIRARVKALLSSNKDSANAVFIMHKNKRQWQVCNIVVEGFSLEKIYKAQFAYIINNEGFEGLLKRLRSKS